MPTHVLHADIGRQDDDFLRRAVEELDLGQAAHMRVTMRGEDLDPELVARPISRRLLSERHDGLGKVLGLILAGAQLLIFLINISSGSNIKNGDLAAAFVLCIDSIADLEGYAPFCAS